MLLHKRWFVAVYWIVAVVLIGLGGALGANWGDSEAPTFNNEDKGSEPANGISHLLYQVFGGVLLALVVAAVLAGIWLLLWVRTRRAQNAIGDFDDEDDDAEVMSVGDVEDMFDQVEDDAVENDEAVEDESSGPPSHAR